MSRGGTNQYCNATNLKLTLTSLAFLGLTGTAALAQTATTGTTGTVQAPPKLAEFREAFEKAVAERSAPAKADFAAALELLARTRAQAGDYEGAIRARDRRRELIDGSAAAGTADSDPREGELVVDLARGSRTGSGLKFDARGNKVTGFDKTSQTITWDLSNTSPGMYSAFVTYSCGVGGTSASTGNTIATGGIFTLSEATGLSTTTSSPPLRRTVLPTGGWNKTVTRNIGKISVTGSLLRLQLKVLKAEPGGLMHLYGIRLVPASSDGDAGSGEPAELSELREKFRTAIANQSAPLIMAYGAALSSLLEQLTDSNQLEAAFDVQKEYLRAQKLAKDPSLILDPPPAE